MRTKDIKAGTKLSINGTVGTVLAVSAPHGKLAGISLGWLEDGKPETYEVPGKFLAAGRMIELSNVRRMDLCNRRNAFDGIEIVGG